MCVCMHMHECVFMHLHVCANGRRVLFPNYAMMGAGKGGRELLLTVPGKPDRTGKGCFPKRRDVGQSNPCKIKFPDITFFKCYSHCIELKVFCLFLILTQWPIQLFCLWILDSMFQLFLYMSYFMLHFQLKFISENIWSSITVGKDPFFFWHYILPHIVQWLTKWILVSGISVLECWLYHVIIGWPLEISLISLNLGFLNLQSGKNDGLLLINMLY